MTAWTKVPPPTGTTSIVTNNFTGGEPYGLLIAITQSETSAGSIITISPWTSVVTATSGGWTSVITSN